MATFFWLAPQVETYAFPVVSNLEILTIDETDKNLEIYGKIDKNRECALDSFNMIVKNAQGDILNLPVYKIDALNGELTDKVQNRPPGVNYFGPWIIPKVYIPANKEFEYVFVVFEHHCTPLWDTITVLGPYDFLTKITR